MSFMPRDEFIQKFAASNGNSTMVRQVRSILTADDYDNERPRFNYNAEAAAQTYDELRQFFGGGGFMFKRLRPWDVTDNFYGKLDRNEPWFGFEFETGYRRSEDRRAMVDFTWEMSDAVTYDGEGEGSYMCEVTFGPQERSKFESGEADAAKFMNWIFENQNRTNRTGHDMIGTHINYSHPRMVNAATRNMVVSLFNRTLGTLNGAQNLSLFGRSRLYGGFFPQESGKSFWTEGKCFRTTYDRAEWDRYMKVVYALSDAVDLMFELYDAGALANGTIETWSGLTEKSKVRIINLEDVVDGNDPAILLSASIENPEVGSKLHKERARQEKATTIRAMQEQRAPRRRTTATAV